MSLRSISAIFTLSLLMISAAGAGERNAWKISPMSHSTGYTVPGTKFTQLEFGMLKHSNICASDELYLVWSSDQSGVWSLPGKRINVLAEFDGKALEMPLEVVSIRELGGGRHLVTLSHVYANQAVIELISTSKQLTVSMPSDDPHLAEMFSVSKEHFDISGFVDARALARQRCNGLSDQMASAGAL